MATVAEKCRSMRRLVNSASVLLPLLVTACLISVLVFVGSHRLHEGTWRISSPESSSVPLQMKMTRKLLVADTERISSTCTNADISILQGHSSPLPNGIPTYAVQITNFCPRPGCSISAIHVSCGWFASAKLVNPSVFRRLKYDDCLVNDGKPLKGGETISFLYANSFQYPLKVSSTSCY